MGKELIRKKAANLLGKLIKLKPPCSGCFGTGKYHVYTNGTLKLPCNICKAVNPTQSKEYYEYFLFLYTKNCECLWHVDYYGGVIDK